MKDLNIKIFEKFDQQWALLTAGTPEKFNTMTISWGGLGTLWSRPVATVYVKPCRYTYEFMENSEYFTVSFFPEACKKDLGILGSKSGRDGDKLALTKLHAKKLENGIGFEEASLTIVCRKIYFQDLEPDRVPKDAVEHYYRTEPVHRMYIGEVIDVIENG